MSAIHEAFDHTHNQKIMKFRKNEDIYVANDKQDCTLPYQSKIYRITYYCKFPPGEAQELQWDEISTSCTTDKF